MIQVFPFNFKNMYKYLSLALIAGLFFLSADAQHRNERREGRPDRSFSPNSNREPRMQQQQRRQYPVASNQSNNRWNREGNRSERRFEPRQIERQPRNGNGGYNRPDNNRRFDNGNRFGNDRHYARASRYDNYRNWPGYRRPVYSSRNPGWRYSYLPRRNSIIASFSFPFQTIFWGGYNYRYCDGVYYRPYNNVFQVVAPPIGIYINTLPFGYRRIVVNDYPYYYYNGTYYDEYEESYRVVAPPVGAVVESIPEGYETIVIDGETYYKVDGVQYKPVVQDNGEIWYEVIKVF
jgi:hypothetical protein